MAGPFDDSPIPSGWARRIERLEQLVEVDPFGDRGESNAEQAEVAFWKRRYDEQHRTVHAMEDQIKELRALEPALRKLVDEASFLALADGAWQWWVSARLILETLGKGPAPRSTYRGESQ